MNQVKMAARRYSVSRIKPSNPNMFTSGKIEERGPTKRLAKEFLLANEKPAPFRNMESHQIPGSMRGTPAIQENRYRRTRGMPQLRIA